MQNINPEQISDKLDRLYRNNYGKLVSVLTNTFGTQHLGLIEDMVQEAILAALQKWTSAGLPEDPAAWIYQVAKRKTINNLNREKYQRAYVSEASHTLDWEEQLNVEAIFTDQEIADDQLRMIFTCCHPSLSTDSQIALILKTLCGFSITEIANGFLSKEDSINKRLVRARNTIREGGIAFEVPSGRELEKRLGTVLETIYLLFNEGYHATSGDQFIRQELCEEAILLAEIIASHPLTGTSNVFALLSLMTLNSVRFNSRIDEYDNIIDLAHQDRSK